MEFRQQRTGLDTLKKRSLWPWIIGVIVGVLVIIGIIAGSLVGWYVQNLQPLDAKATHKIRVTVLAGESVNTIAKKLASEKIIKNAVAFELYLKFQQSSAQLQAGTYAISPSLSAKDIVAHLQSGKTDLFMITILPGNTLGDIKKTLKNYGYSESEIEKALKATYSTPLLADKPSQLDLEGYIYPETFEMQSDNDLQSLLKRDFDTLYAKLSQDGLIDKFKARGFNLHQALTLGSIIQKEASGAEDQRKIAQVFYKRLGMGMKLETDPTFMYAAKKLGVEPRVNLDSPYNTRLYPGLPPGPIGNMNYSALQAVANPASTDYLYFVAGDDGTNYFSHTLEEHENYVKKYCHKLCQ